jgi:hypothetical protein
MRRSALLQSGFPDTSFHEIPYRKKPCSIALLVNIAGTPYLGGHWKPAAKNPGSKRACASR